MRRNTCLRCQEPLNQPLKWEHLWQFKRLEFECICSKCQAAFLETRNNSYCQYCLHPLESGACCQDCKRWLRLYGEQYLKHDAIYLYNDAFQAWITDYKYRGDVRQATIMKEKLRVFYQKYRDYEWTILPSSTRNFEKRGFNPSEYLLKQAGVPYTVQLEYRGDNQSQAKKTKEERLQLHSVFQLKASIKPNQKFLIFDDVYTTGATLMHAKKIFIDSGCMECLSLSLARDVMV